MKSFLKKAFAVLAASLALFSCSDIMGDLKISSPKPPRPKDYSIPLTIEAEVGGAKVTFVNKAAGPVTYKVNGGTEMQITSGVTEIINLYNVGDKVEFWGDNPTYATGYTNYSNITCASVNEGACVCNLYGNIMSLISSKSFKDAKELDENYTFTYLFKDNANIKIKEGADFLLPATKLAESCYNGMFYNCNNLTTAPELPATKLANYCYEMMFYGCEKLTAAPALPAKTLTDRCYRQMFSNTSLTVGPALPATKLTESCYEGMFSKTNLTEAPALPATDLAESCYDSMFLICENLMIAPTLPAKNLAPYCYYHMFKRCKNLSSVTCLAKKSATDCTTDWLDGVASNGTFTKAADATWPKGASGIPTKWTPVDYPASQP